MVLRVRREEFQLVGCEDAVHREDLGGVGGAKVQHPTDLGLSCSPLLLEKFSLNG